MEVVQIDKEILNIMFEMMDYQTELITRLYERISPINTGKWLSTEDVARLLSVSERKVRMMRATGKLGFIKNGNACLYKAEDVTSLIKKDPDD